MPSRNQSLLPPLIQNPILCPGGDRWRGDDTCARSVLKNDKSSHQHVLTIIKCTVLVTIWIFKDLDRSREKGIRGKRKCKANALVIQTKGVIREGWGFIR